MEKTNVPDSQIKLSIGKQNFYVLRSEFQNSTWKYVIYSMVAYFLTPILIPSMILLSKVLKREIHFGKIEEED